MTVAGARATAFALLLCLVSASADAAAQQLPTTADLAGLEWRSIGPAEMGGRTVDIAAIPGDPSTVYFATASGGL